MNAPEHHLLSLLRPDDMIRFVLYRSNHDPDQIAFTIEGDPANQGNDALAKRLALGLHALRDIGFRFDREQNGGQKERSPLVQPQSDCRVVEVRPASLPLAGLDQGALGFTDGAEAAADGGRLALPSFHAFSDLHLFGSLADAVLGVPEIARFELEFTRFDLSKDRVRTLEQALTLIQLAMGPSAGENTLPQQTFLSLWLLHRSGWKLRARTWLPRESAIPEAALEVIGRDIFSCDCDIAEASEPRPANGEIDLSNCYPRGWKFPAMLPPPRLFDNLSASRLHNQDLPRLPEDGFGIGTADGKPVRLPRESRDRHTYIVGGTGTGKSTLLLRMIREDMERGEGVILVDPHGDLYRQAMNAVPAARKNDLFHLDPADPGKPPGLNILDIPDSPLRRRHAGLLIDGLFRFFSEIWDMKQVAGPMFEMYFRNTLLLMCLKQPSEAERGLQGDTPALNLAQFSRVMTDKDLRNWLLKHCPDETVKAFWTNVAEKAGGEASLQNVAPYIISKVNGLVQGGYLSDLLKSGHNEFQLGQRMDRNGIILLNLNKGLIGSNECRLLGTILMMEIFAAGLQRSLVPEKDRRPVNVYVDEFQNFVSDNAGTMLSEGRKFGLRLTLANQTLGQLAASPGQQNLLETVLGNVGNMILFRLGIPDAERLKLFLEPFSRQEMQELPNFHAMVRLLTSEGPVRPVIMKTIEA